MNDQEKKDRPPEAAGGGEPPAAQSEAAKAPPADQAAAGAKPRSRGGRRRRPASGEAPAAPAPEAPAAGGTAPDSVAAARPDAGAAAAKPRRRSRRRKPAAPGAAEGAPPVQPEEPAGPSAVGLPAAVVDVTPAAEAAAAEAPKKPRRRGGRRRRAGVGDGEVAAPVSEVPSEGAVHESAAVAGAGPAAERGVAVERGMAETVAVDGVTEGGPQGEGESPDGPRKRRRRGSRGGRRVRAREARRAAAEGAVVGSAATGVAAAADAALLEPVHAVERVPEASVETQEPETGATPPGEDVVKPRRRRRSGRGRRGAAAEGVPTAEDAAAPAAAPAPEELSSPAADAVAAPVEGAAEEPPQPQAKAKRRGRRRGAGETAAEAVRAGSETPAAVAEEPAAGAEPTAEETKPKRRRRRTKADVAAEESSAVTADRAAGTEGPAAEPGKEAASKTERGRRRDRRRPRAIVRLAEGSGVEAESAAPATHRRPEVTVQLPKRKLILITEDRSELRVALVEDGRLAEIYFERPDKRSYLGDIYRGKVENVLSGIDAAFVDFGLDKNGFLYVDEVRGDDGHRRGRRIGDVLKPGQDVLVQVMKDPMGSKGARLTTQISLAGRYVVYVPNGSGVGVSRRLPQGERERLRGLCQDLKTKNAGLIVRTAAEGEGLEAIKRDVRFLSRLWSRLKKKAETAPIPGLVHKEVDIALEVTRDLFNESVESLVVDTEKRRKDVVAFLDKVAPELVSRVHLHTGKEPLFEAYGIEQQISKALERRVPLPSGGNIVIDHAEALTVIDVNSGRYTSGKGLEETILRTNLEAAREVVRQLRLRDIGGILIIDFIDMAHVRNRETVLATLEAELDTDRTKTYVVELSPLGLVEMTRQNTTDGARGILTRSCACCQGKGRTLSEETVALSVERRLRVQSARSGAKACLVELNAGVAERLTGRRLKELEKETGRRIFVEGSSALPIDSFKILAEGSPEHVQAQRIPVSEGQEVELELEYSLTYSPRDAVGYVSGYMVIVEGGRTSLGERRMVKISSATRTGATAVLAAGRGARGGGGAA